jgi:formiminotetrahydrofolate cyclodeaminase
MDPIAGMTVAALLEGLASKTPAPGGGAVAGLVAAQAAALASMVVAYSLGRKSLAAHQAELAEIAGLLAEARARGLALADADAEAYAALSGLWSLPANDEGRARQFLPALRRAVDVPRSVLGQADALLRLCERLGPITNPKLASDLLAAVVLAEAAGVLASLNIHANLGLLPDPAERQALEAQTEADLAANAACVARLRAASNP